MWLAWVAFLLVGNTACVFAGYFPAWNAFVAGAMLMLLLAELIERYGSE